MAPQPTITYYATKADALSLSNSLGGSTSSYIVNGSVLYPYWSIATNSSGTGPRLQVYVNGNLLVPGGSYNLYPTPYITYYGSRDDAEAQTNEIGTSDFTVNHVDFTYWSMTTTSLGTSLKSAAYTNGSVLNEDGPYYLYPTPIMYYATQADAENETNPVGNGDYNVIVFSSYTGWRIAGNSSGTSSQNTVFVDGNNLIQDGIYNLYAAVPCFLEGSLLLCLVDGVEQNVPVEKLIKGTLVKTSLDGYKPVVLIGKGTLQNPGDDERIENRLYKCSPSKYPNLTADLYLTGCHSILEFPLTDQQREATLQKWGKLFVTDKKHRLMACVDQRAEPWNSLGEYTIWHFALEHRDEGMNYGVYANGLLVETCSIRFLKNKSNMLLS
jgi:hypothetical protein